MIYSNTEYKLFDVRMQEVVIKEYIDKDFRFYIK